MDTLDKTTRSRVMGMIKSKETKLEKILLTKLWREGIRYGKHTAKLFGRPDISFSNRRLVIFIDSCFWHGCSEHLRMPHSNIDYWNNKVERNKKRDQIVIAHYKEKKWKILRFWEHRIKDDLEEVIKEIKLAIMEISRN